MSLQGARVASQTGANMTKPTNDSDAYYVRALDPMTDQLVPYRCAGMPGAQAKPYESLYGERWVHP